ncbi:hypothetical protein Hypma_015894 [Hypsizygus marmoreus]|uniref:Uncharacterized protein n=1 Tax=Hypsizygus marmoreus TaxID=39966 RepID=A0A369KAE4_HYPMA|nr:hypothetical protein Hypma_015894 [Hypsizygus marmoreus]
MYPQQLLWSASPLAAVFFVILALFFGPWKNYKNQPIDDAERQPLLQALGPSFALNFDVTLERFVSYPAATQVPDTTAVILNWSRLPDVRRIVALLCGSSLDQTIAAIIVWNNSPQKLTEHDFVACPKGKLTIRNSPSNLYFQARFIACSQASTHYCFIQDDDYLVWPEIIQAVHAYIKRSTSLGVYLLPPHEKLSSDLRAISVGSDVHTSFAWLGHGALIPRARAIQFLALMNWFNASDEELNMADNYFTILSNTFVETWFDQGVELGGGQPFTVGSEGEERNRRHILRATDMLESIVASNDTSCSQVSEIPDLPYIQRGLQLDPPQVFRAPCLGSACLLETTINILPETVQHAASSASEMFALETANKKRIGVARMTHYLSHSPSNAVDGNPETAFCSFDNAKPGDMISLDVFTSQGLELQHVELAFLVDVPTESILRASVFEVGNAGNRAVSTISYELVCVDTGIVPPDRDFRFLRECSIQMLPSIDIAGAHVFRARLQKEMNQNWCIHEVWLRVRRSQ